MARRVVKYLYFNRSQGRNVRKKGTWQSHDSALRTWEVLGTNDVDECSIWKERYPRIVVRCERFRDFLGIWCVLHTMLTVGNDVPTIAIFTTTRHVRKTGVILYQAHSKQLQYYVRHLLEQPSEEAYVYWGIIYTGLNWFRLFTAWWSKRINGGISSNGRYASENRHFELLLESRRLFVTSIACSIQAEFYQVERVFQLMESIHQNEENHVEPSCTPFV